MCEGVSPLTSVDLRSAIWRMFRNTADEDYIVARWCAFAHQPYQFYWNGAQAIEKYLKCALLQNDVSVKNFGHDIKSLYDELAKVSADLLPWLFVPPRGFELRRKMSFSAYKVCEPYETIVARFAFQGDSSNRYRTFSLRSDMFDLCKLDELCFQLRRLCFPLKIDYGGFGTPYDEMIKAQPHFQPHTPLYPLRSTARAGDKERHRIAKKMNFSFFQERAYKTGKYLTATSSENSQLYLELSSKKSDKSHLVEWLLAHCQFSKPVRDELAQWLSDGFNG